MFVFFLGLFLYFRRRLKVVMLSRWVSCHIACSFSCLRSPECSPSSCEFQWLPWQDIYVDHLSGMDSTTNVFLWQEFHRSHLQVRMQWLWMEVQEAQGQNCVSVMTSVFPSRWSPDSRPSKPKACLAFLFPLWFLSIYVCSFFSILSSVDFTSFLSQSASI